MGSFEARPDDEILPNATTNPTPPGRDRWGKPPGYRPSWGDDRGPNPNAIEIRPAAALRRTRHHIQSNQYHLLSFQDFSQIIPRGESAPEVALWVGPAGVDSTRLWASVSTGLTSSVLPPACFDHGRSPHASAQENAPRSSGHRSVLRPLRSADRGTGDRGRVAEPLRLVLPPAERARELRDPPAGCAGEGGGVAHSSLTGPSLAFRPITSGHDTTPGRRCQACRERIAGTTAWDELYRPYHPACLSTQRRNARKPC